MPTPRYPRPPWRRPSQPVRCQRSAGWLGAGQLGLLILGQLAWGAPVWALDIPFEQYQLENGLNVILHEDHSLPQVVVNIMYKVGSKDEVEGRSGFAHLFEHLMFMGTTRLPGAGFDELMEANGGWNNAWTSNDATDYYDVGPSPLLGTFLWMEADRMDGLGKAMTKEKVNLQREVVRNERRQTSEDEPYGVLELELPAILYPAGHPYAHSVIGSHEDLQAAGLSDVVGFFGTWYVPNNASLVVAGDFDKATAKAEIQRLFGVLPRKELPARTTPPAPDKPMKALTELTDQVQIPMSVLTWHSPAWLQPGDAEMDLLGSILAGGRSSRLYRRMVEGDESALEVSAWQESGALSSTFVIDVKPTPKHTLEEVEGVIAEELARIAKEGPTPAEMERVRNQTRKGYLGSLEELQDRALTLNRFWYTTGNPGDAAGQLDRYAAVTAAGIQAAAQQLNRERLATVRIRPVAGEK